MEDILDNVDEFIEDERIFEKASMGQRFANFLIDYVGMLIFSVIVGVVLGIVLIMLGDESYLYEEEVTIASKITDLIFAILVMTFYYVMLEYFLKGKSLGKFITGTRAVTIDDDRMDLQTTFVRTMCRFIPFEAFSFLGDKPSGWHDTMSQTKVIVDKGWHG